MYGLSFFPETRQDGENHITPNSPNRFERRFLPPLLFTACPMPRPIPPPPPRASGLPHHRQMAKTSRRGSIGRNEIPTPALEQVEHLFGGDGGCHHCMVLWLSFCKPSKRSGPPAAQRGRTRREIGDLGEIVAP